MIEVLDDEDLCHQLFRDIDSLKADVKRNAAQPPSARVIVEIDTQIEQIRELYDKLRKLISANKNATWIKNAKKRSVAIKKEINTLISDHNNRKGVDTNPAPIHIDELSTGQLLAVGAARQTDSIVSLGESLRLINESRDTATSTIAELARQQEQLIGALDETETVKANLAHVGKQLRSIARRVAGDKLIRACTIMILIALTCVILVIAFVPNRAPHSVFDYIGNATRF